MVNFHSKLTTFTNILSRKLFKIFFLFYRKHVNFLLMSLKRMRRTDKCIFPIGAAIKLSQQSVINSFVRETMNNIHLYCFSTVSIRSGGDQSKFCNCNYFLHNTHMASPWQGSWSGQLSSIIWTYTIQYNIKVSKGR